MKIKIKKVLIYNYSSFNFNTKYFIVCYKSNIDNLINVYFNFISIFRNIQKEKNCSFERSKFQFNFKYKLYQIQIKIIFAFDKLEFML